ncbi:type 1 fimbrial protein [Stenotrophomonas sp. STM01]|uniref:fimbrial protein n=1 Tax=Stenotrophomonas sp. STM01 TaxID=2769278 RepID=UPI001780BF7E|nr:fimbrial protein [Stenotrophomonas sp. STM01]MBD9535951.1 type 1 fimbrial protein [Stenotrophomonas sp. STM01]
MRLFKRALAVLVWVTLAGVSPQALAVTCVTDRGVPAVHQMTPSATSLKINPNVPDGTVLGKLQQVLSSYTSAILTCENLTSIDARWEMTTGAYLGNSTYESGIDGIGIRAYYLLTYPFDTPHKRSIPARGPSPVTILLELVKIGPITGKGTLKADFGRVIIPSAGDFVWMTLRMTSSVTVDSGTPTCSVSTPAVPVSMPQAQKYSFTGPGSVSGAQTFNLGVKCVGGNAGTSVGVYTVLTDQTDPGNRSNALSLSADSTASGVGVQIVHAGNILSYGPDQKGAGTENRWFAGRSEAGDFIIPLSARYVQTGQTVTPGSANARATFTLSYE